MMTAVLDRTPSSARQSDWRFLLPRAEGRAFEHLLLFGGSPELAASLLDLRVANRVSCEVRRGERADAVIVLAGAAESLETAAPCVSDNGVLYCEIDRRTPRQFGVTPANALRRARRHGLTPTAAYWVKPGFPERQMYLPLDAQCAFQWYLDTLFRSTTRPRRALRAGLRALARDRAGLARFAPCFAITAVRGSARFPAVLERAYHEGIWNGNATQPVLLAHGAAEWSRVALLLFDTNARCPKAVLKLPRRSLFNPQIEWEHKILRQLGFGLPDAMRESLPVSALFRWNDLAVSVETCVTGATLSSRTGAADNDALEDLHLTASWLASFHRQTTIETVPARAWLNRHLINGICADYAATFGLTGAERQLFATLSSCLERADLGMMPIVWQHMDFGPWNVYRDSNRLSVIDWEMARRGPALADLLYFATHWGSAVAKSAGDADGLDHFASLFCAPSSPNAFVRAIRREIAEYMRGLDVGTSLFAFLLFYTFLEQALDRAGRFKTLECANGASRAGNRYVGYLGVLAQHANALFTEEAGRA